MSVTSKIGLIVSSLLLVVSFQNCSNRASFTAGGELVPKTDVSDAGVENILDDGVGDDVINPGDGTPVTPVNPTVPPRDTTDNDDDDGDGIPNRDDEDCNDRGGNHAGGNRPPSHSSPPSRPADSNLSFVCVLEGPGHSIKVGLSAEGLEGQTGTPRDVCMTENACVNIISTKFDVKAAKRAGFCPNKNPHVVSMTDAQISAALAQAQLLREISVSRYGKSY